MQRHLPIPIPYIPGSRNLKFFLHHDVGGIVFESSAFKRDSRVDLRFVLVLYDDSGKSCVFRGLYRGAGVGYFGRFGFYTHFRTISRDNVLEVSFFSRVHATLQPAMSVGPSVRPSVTLCFYGVYGRFGGYSSCPTA